VRRLLRPAPAIAAQPEPKLPDELVNISGSLAKPPTPRSGRSGSAGRQSRAKAAHGMVEPSRARSNRGIWRRKGSLAFRWLRCGWETDALRSGREARNIYASLGRRSMRAREISRAAYDRSTMVDYLHLESSAVWLMMMRSCLAPAIPARWSRIHVNLPLLAVLLLLWSRSRGSQDLASLVKCIGRRRQWRGGRGSRVWHPYIQDQDGRLPSGPGLTSFEQKDYDRAARHLKAAQTRLPKIEDYAVYYLASARLQAKTKPASPSSLDKFQTLPIASPLAAPRYSARGQGADRLAEPRRRLCASCASVTPTCPSPTADLTRRHGLRGRPPTRFNCRGLLSACLFWLSDTDAAVRAARRDSFC